VTRALRRFAATATFGCALAGCGPGTPPAGDYAVVAGRVLDGAGMPIAGAVVTVDGVRTVTTDADGNYSIPIVPTGPWSYAASAGGYAPVGSDQPAPLSPGEKRSFAITLHKR